MAESVSNVNRANWIWVPKQVSTLSLMWRCRWDCSIFFGLYIFRCFWPRRQCFELSRLLMDLKPNYFVGTWGCKSIYLSHFTRARIWGWNDTRFKTLAFMFAKRERVCVFVTCILISVLYWKVCAGRHAHFMFPVKMPCCAAVSFTSLRNMKAVMKMHIYQPVINEKYIQKDENLSFKIFQILFSIPRCSSVCVRVCVCVLACVCVWERGRAVFQWENWWNKLFTNKC